MINTTHPKILQPQVYYRNSKPGIVVTTKQYEYPFTQLNISGALLPTVDFTEKYKIGSITVPARLPVDIFEVPCHRLIQDLTRENIFPNVRERMERLIYLCCLKQIIETMGPTKPYYWFKSVRDLHPMCPKFLEPYIQSLGNFKLNNGTVRFDPRLAFTWLMRANACLNQAQGDEMPIHPPPVSQECLHLDPDESDLISQRLTKAAEDLCATTKVTVQVLQPGVGVNAGILVAVQVNFKWDDFCRIIRTWNVNQQPPQTQQVLGALAELYTILHQRVAGRSIQQQTAANWSQVLSNLTGISLYAQALRPERVVKKMIKWCNEFAEQYSHQISSVNFGFFQPSSEGTRAQTVYVEGFTSVSEIPTDAHAHTIGYMFDMSGTLDLEKFVGKRSHTSQSRPFYVLFK